MTYDSELVSEVFGNLSVDKSRLPANISAIAPKFVTEWLVDKLVPGRGKLTEILHHSRKGVVERAEM